MLRTPQNKPNLIIYQTIERITSSGKLSRRDYLLLTSTLLSDEKITDEERHQINRIFDYVQVGRLKFVD
ncbi:hypothetical protein BCD67_23400 [Oscillatoriales cyanobacterium USR001]|nr:hypothetical protein BCD67_23400 [Oscillatoriales cyanobacterium USR001]